jgi:DNA-binding CsgD family transcriptional regulator
MPEVGLLEREVEFAAIHHTLDRAQAGGGGLLLLEGAPGIGKSSLVNYARRCAADRAFETVYASAGELEQDFAFAVVRQLFETRATANEAAAVLGLSPPRSTAGVPALESALQALHRLTATLTAERPLAIMIDDLQWADTASLRWLDYLARRIGGLPLAAIVSVRANDPSLDALDLNGRIFASLRRGPSTTVRGLEPLTASAVTTYVQSLNPEADPFFCETCHTATEGNPALLRKVLAAIDAQGAVYNIHASPLVEAIGAETIAQAALASIQDLPSPAMQLARAVSVLDENAPLRHAAVLTSLSEDEVARCAGLLTRHRIFLASEELHFRSALVRALVYEEIPPAERALAHARVARLLRAEGAPAERIAAHLLLAEPGVLAGSLETLRSAARAAGARGDPELGARYLRLALAEPGGETVRGDVLYELSSLLATAEDPQALAAMREAISLTSDPALRAERTLALVHSLGTSGHQTEAAQACAVGLAELDGVHAELQNRLKAELTANAYASPHLPSNATGRVALLAEPIQSDQHPLPALAAHRAIDLTRRCGPAEEIVAAVEQGVEAGLLKELPSLTTALALLALVWADHTDLAHRRLEEALATTRRTDAPQLSGPLSVLTALTASQAGELDDAEMLVHDVYLRITRQPTAPASLLWCAALLIDVLLSRGDIDAAQRVLEQASSQLPSSEYLASAVLLERRARIDALTKGPVAALPEMLRCGELMDRIDLRNPALTQWRSRAALLHHAHREQPQAERLATEELALAERFGTPRVRGVALHRLALLADAGVDIQLLKDATAVLESSPARLELAAAQLDLGRALRRGRQRQAAREPLRNALDIAAACGATRLAGQARDELVATGARPRRARMTGVNALTAREHRVASLAANGLSNREIAAALYITRRTVEMHLTSIYQKLAIGSRGELDRVIPTEDRIPLTYPPWGPSQG